VLASLRLVNFRLARPLACARCALILGHWTAISEIPVTGWQTVSARSQFSSDSSDQTLRWKSPLYRD